MANNIVTIDHIAAMVMDNLYSATVAAQTVHRDYSQEFVKGRGRKITVVRPATFVAKKFDRAQGIEVQDAEEDTFDLELDQHYDVSFSFTSIERTLDVTDYERRFARPAALALAQQMDGDVIATAQAGLTATVGTATPNAAGEEYTGYNGDYPWSDSRVLIQAGEVLNKNKVPFEDRFALNGPTTAARWAAEKTWRHANRHGNTAGLHEANFGEKKHGFTPFMTPNVGQPAQSPTTGQPTTEISPAYHRTAIALVTRPIEVPTGAADARIIDFEGFSIRIVVGYDQSKKEDVISYDCLYGVKVINPDRGVKIRGPLAA